MDFKDAPQPVIIQGVGVATPVTPFTRALGVAPAIRPSTFPVAVFDAKLGEFTTTREGR